MCWWALVALLGTIHIFTRSLHFARIYRLHERGTFEIYREVDVSAVR